MSPARPPRNRLAKPLPASWRRFLVEQGVPKRKYTAVCRVTLQDGRVFDQVVIETGWIIASDRAALADRFEQRIRFDPRTIATMQILQVI